ncbi:hypothetical protein BJ508DRAFT_412534 [Ascobolus immersus RN42]|uniref:Uncharacterized protein n=1 Tax=Ascobolus immersus RN42 TaxID=1160509 RepID=A0A3N4IF90_ASCIM|nr:hypothetical protein BJ508DRAFT_412534 [Ascobolus immersus RN42]
METHAKPEEYWRGLERGEVLPLPWREESKEQDSDEHDSKKGKDSNDRDSEKGKDLKDDDSDWSDSDE